MTDIDQDQQDKAGPDPLEQLRGSVDKLIDPYEPTTDLEDWKALRDD